MKQKRVILTLLAICFTARVFAELSLCDSLLIPIDSTVKVGILPNGLTYYIKRNNWPENRVCFYLAQRVGSLQEEDNQRGLLIFWNTCVLMVVNTSQAMELTGSLKVLGLTME